MALVRELGPEVVFFTVVLAPRLEIPILAFTSESHALQTGQHDGPQGCIINLTCKHVNTRDAPALPY